MSETTLASDRPAAGAADVVRDGDGRLVLPTTTVPEIVLPARISEELELAGAEASVIVEPETERCQLVVTLETQDIGFAFDSDELTDAGRHTIELVAAELTGVTLVLVAGHSSSEGDPAYNVDLSLRRANAVAAVLRPLLPSSGFFVDGKGAAEPVATNDTEEGRAKNRRVVIAGDVEREECQRAAGDG